MAGPAGSSKEPDSTQSASLKREPSGQNLVGSMSRDSNSWHQMAARPTSPRLTRSATAPAPSLQPHTATSPLASREASPNRTIQTAAKFGGVRVTRSRKNSADHSPQRVSTNTLHASQNTPSATAVQRALTAVGNQRLPSPTSANFAGESSDPQKPGRRRGSTQTAQVRMRSPPSTGLVSISSSKLAEPQQPISSTSNHATSKPSSGIETIQEEDDNDATHPDVSDVKRDGSLPEGDNEEESKQSFTDVSAQSKTTFRPSTIQEDPDEDNPDMTSSQTTTATRFSKTNTESGSGSEGADRRGETDKAKDKEKEKEKDRENAVETQKAAALPAAASRKPSITQLAPSKPSALQARRSFQHLNPARSKVQSEGSVKSLTVETETVSNPDLLADDRETRASSGRLDATGSVRTRTSTETIRPRKEKRRVRKPANIASGTASSKADIFEAKVASAVDEAANSSDSEETFVYDSNPPDPRSSHRNHHGQRHHHSRTPSAASMGSQTADHRSRSSHFGIAGKKSMKFTNAHQLRDADDEDGTSTYSSNTARSSHRHHHHIARLGRLHNVAQDGDSPMPSSASSPRVRQSSGWRFHGPRTAQDQVQDQDQDQDQILPAMVDKSGPSKVFDLSGSAEADGEFAPLLGSAGRLGRGEHRRRPLRSSRLDSYQRGPLRSCVQLIKYSCMAITVTLALGIVVLGMILCNRQLYDVHVHAVRNVLVSEQELIVNLEVHAVNPNLVDISIASGDLDLFAKSKYVGTTEMWRNGTIPGIDSPLPSRRRHHHRAGNVEIEGGVDEGTDPIDEPVTGPQTMLLGRIHELDSPLVFESSPFYRNYRSSTSGLRLVKPGNKTEEGGSRRWENVMQHEFELIIRGRLRYVLPLSNKAYTVIVDGSAKVMPEIPSTGPGRSSDTVGTSEKDSTRRKMVHQRAFQA